MHVIRASKAGFCMGVSLALKQLEDALQARSSRQGAMRGARICTLGPIIHNPQVLAHFAGQGVSCLDSASLARGGDCVLIRAHGIPRDEEAILRQKAALVLDATCPKVKSAQLGIAEATAGGEALLLFGEASHPEVRGLVSYARGSALVFSSREEADNIDIDESRAYVLAAQTTQDRDSFEIIANRLSSRLPRLAVLSTICDATRQRQDEALRLAAEVEAMVVVGGRQSGNTRRLANLAARAGIAAFHVESLGELKPADFAGKAKVGLTAGASTPKALIDEIEKWLEAL